MDRIFYNKDGSCTKYALACGYVQVAGNVQLYREHGCYHLLRLVDDRYERSATASLTEARAMFRGARAKDRSIAPSE